MVRRHEWVVQVFGLFRSIAAPEAGATALETVTALTTARETAAGTTNNAPDYREDDQPAHDNYGNDRPPNRYCQ